MRDRNGAELKPGDECEFTCRVKVVTAVEPPDGRLFVTREGKGGTMFLTTPEQLTKVVPEFEWRESKDRAANDEWLLYGMRKDGTRSPQVVLQQRLTGNKVVWMIDGKDHGPTLEAAKAAALAACRSAAEGGKEQS